MTQQVQKRNAQMVDLLRQDFQHRREPNYAWSRAVSMYQALPGLRGFWPMSSINYTAANRAIDLSGQSNHLTANFTPAFGYRSLAPAVEFAGLADYLSRADGGAANWADITGAETYVRATQRGLTLGGWFYFNNAAGANESLMSKFGAGGQRSYEIFRFLTGVIRFRVSVDGTAITQVDSVSSPGQGVWKFIAGRFIPSTTISIFVDDERTDNAVAIPASIFDSTAQFTVGTISGLANYFAGRASMLFLCAAQLSDAIILSLFEQTRALYGV